MEKLYGGSNFITLPKKLEIPEIDDNRLKELYQLLKPIVTIDEMKYLLREFTFNLIFGIVMKIREMLLIQIN